MKGKEGEGQPIEKLCSTVCCCTDLRFTGLFERGRELQQSRELMIATLRKGQVLFVRKEKNPLGARYCRGEVKRKELRTQKGAPAGETFSFAKKDVLHFKISIAGVWRGRSGLNDFWRGPIGTQPCKIGDGLQQGGEGRRHLWKEPGSTLH